MPHTPRVKICGLRRQADIALANAVQPDYIGFVFAKSKRQVSIETAQTLKAALSPTIQAVGVFVNSDASFIHALLNTNIIDIVQLHGSECEADILALKAAYPTVPIIKAVSVRSTADILAWANSSADYLLLDNGAGGTGQAFDWAVLPALKQHHFTKPYFIAGGLCAENITDVLAFAPFGVDVSGGVEEKETGYKSPEKVAELIQIVREEPRG